ncbi:MAG: GGDEF domain-containing protein [Terracidiphilus sp.]
MNETVPDSLTVLPDPRLFRAARWMQRVWLGIAAIAVLLGLMPLAGMPVIGSSVAAAHGDLPFLLTAFLCGLSLFLSEPDRTGIAVGYARRIANLFAICGLISVLILGRRAAANPLHVVFPPASFLVGLCTLTVAVILVDQKNWLINRLVDVLVCGLCLMSLLFVSDEVFGSFALFGRRASNPGTVALLVCLVALAIVVTLQQAEHGVLSIFLGVGHGSNLARVFAPILVVLPFAWESLREWMNRAGNGGHLEAALLASASVAVAVGILLFFTWRMISMENEIQDLILRDEATRLYNLRGFHMLAEHALRLAQRSGVPFSVLFIDLENLAGVHAQLGPDASAAALAEAGVILRATFRESDIKGRIGADEFAVAGQFDRAGISIAALRLEAATAARNAKSGKSIPLNFSMGHVTTSGGDSQESLKEMLDRAGQLRNRQEGLLKEMLVN